MKKSKKKLVGLIVLLAGVLLFIFAKYQQHRDKTYITVETETFTDEPASKTATLEIERKASPEERSREIIGIILIVFGAGMLFFYRKKA